MATSGNSVSYPDLERWLLEESIIHSALANLTTTLTQVLPRDPYRFFLTLPWSGAANISIFFGTSAPANPSIVQGTSGPWLYVTRTDLGDLITEPLFAAVSTGTYAQTIQTTSYHPERKRIYDRILYDFFSQYSS